MKTTLLLSTLVLATSTTAFAQGFNDNQNNQAGFSGPKAGITTVEQVLSSGMFSDDSLVTLTGHIQSALGGEHYLFRDKTGEVEIEIDHKLWAGRAVTPETQLVISGEIDKDFNKTTVDVDALKIIN